MDKIQIIIPALNEEKAIGRVISDLPSERIEEVVVVDNGSSDRTSEVAKEHGATVLLQPIKGYGKACLTALEYLGSKADETSIIVFMDGDYSDHADDLSKLIQPIVENKADFVLGSRVLGKRERGSLTPQQRFGNALATTMIRWLYGVRYTDLGPFRAIRYDQLMDLGMKDQNFGWTVEMQINAAKRKVRTMEVPVDYRVRIGQSKVSGTLRGSILAGYKIIATILRYA